MADAASAGASFRGGWQCSAADGLDMAGANSAATGTGEVPAMGAGELVEAVCGALAEAASAAAGKAVILFL
jgi:hypothetical protein